MVYQQAERDLARLSEDIQVHLYTIHAIHTIHAKHTDEPHLRGIGACVKLFGLNSYKYNGLKGRIESEGPETHDSTIKNIAVKLDYRRFVKVRLKNLKYVHSEYGVHWILLAWYSRDSVDVCTS